MQVIASFQVVTVQIPQKILQLPVMFSFDSSGTNFFIHSLFSLKIYVKIRGE